MMSLLEIGFSRSLDVVEQFEFGLDRCKIVFLQLLLVIWRMLRVLEFELLSLGFLVQFICSDLE
jgi:hypothetical protein